MNVITEEKSKEIFIRLGIADGEKHILQCLYLVESDFKLTEHWNEIFSAF